MRGRAGPGGQRSGLSGAEGARLWGEQADARTRTSRCGARMSRLASRITVALAASSVEALASSATARSSAVRITDCGRQQCAGRIVQRSLQRAPSPCARSRDPEIPRSQILSS